jgi:hypothetical protein
MENNNITLDLDLEQLFDLCLIVQDNLSQVATLIDNETAAGDPHDKVESLSFRYDETRKLLLDLEKTLQPTPFVEGELQTHFSVWYPVDAN